MTVVFGCPSFLAWTLTTVKQLKGFTILERDLREDLKFEPFDWRQRKLAVVKDRQDASGLSSYGRGARSGAGGSPECL